MILTETQTAIRDEVAKFARERIAPRARDVRGGKAAIRPSSTSISPAWA